MYSACCPVSTENTNYLFIIFITVPTHHTQVYMCGCERKMLLEVNRIPRIVENKKNHTMLVDKYAIRVICILQIDICMSNFVLIKSTAYS